MGSGEAVSEEQTDANEVIGFLSDLGINAFEMYTVGFPFGDEDAPENDVHSREVSARSYVCGSHHGVVFIIRVKLLGEHSEAEERIFLRRVQKCGHVAFIARTLEQVAEELSKHWPESLLNHH